MAKEALKEFAVDKEVLAFDASPVVDTPRDWHFIEVAIPKQRVITDALLTAALENVLHDLVALKHEIERTNRSDIFDVRGLGDTMGTAMLRGFNDQITHTDLVALIDHMRDGIAQRRVAALN